MSFFGGPRYGGGNQLFPQQFQQQVMQMQLQLQKNLQNLQNRPNQPNNTNNVKNNTDNAKGGKPGMSPNYNKGQNNSMKDSKTNVQNSTNNGPNKNVPNKKDNSNDINESNDKNSKSNVTPLMNISPEKLQDNKPPQPMQSILGKAPQFVKSDSQSNQNLSYETPQFQNRNQRGNFNSPYSHNSNPNRHNSSNRPQLNTPGQGRDFPKQQKNFYGQDRIKDKALQMFNGPQVDLPPMDTSEKKFNSFAKLFIGNLAKNTSQDELTNLFKKYGEINSVYLNKDSSFAFVQLDYKANAIKAQKEVDNSLLKGRNLKVRPATVSEGIKVKNLSPYVSNELLEKSFSVFGPVDSCRIMCDERGLSKGEGVLFFKDKKTAFLAIKKCQEECFFLSGALRPVIVSALDATDETTDGVPESSLPRNDEYHQERKIGPHFAEPNTFEFEFGSQWKSLFTMYDEKKSALDLDFQVEIGRLEKKMALAKVEYEAEQLRKQLAQREAESAELRRHFDGRRDAAGPPPGNSAASYDSYPGGKRPPPMDQSYESSYGASYDQYPADSYDRGAYPTGAYGDRGYDRAYDYPPRDDYRRGHERFDRPAAEGAQERPPYDMPPAAEQSGYGVSPHSAPASASPYAAESNYPSNNKRPRY